MELIEVNKITFARTEADLQNQLHLSSAAITGAAKESGKIPANAIAMTRIVKRK